ncbi:MAG TPA: PilZ domain-containing protein [Pyrinomonadaceae bacterium]|nr:PilZ domain-containing protein [Pyrinomonadaceae bacterium]
MTERRKAERVQVTIDACWEGVVVQCAGTVVDLSATGCFILTSDLVAEEELIRLELSTPTGGSLYLWGEVVYKLPEMGFALRFTGMGDAEREMLALLIEYARFNDATVAA